MTNIPGVYIVGADKGGVGKTMITRALLDYFRSNGIDFKAFDTESPSGALQRFFPDRVQIVDLSKSTDQVKVLDDVGSTQATVIDISARVLSPTLELLAKIGLFDAAKANRLRVNMLHVLGPSTQSLDEAKKVVAAVSGSKYVALANHIDEVDYDAPEGALHVPHLDGDIAKIIDKAAKPFHDYITGGSSFVRCGLARDWLKKVYATFDAAKLNDLT